MPTNPEYLDLTPKATVAKFATVQKPDSVIKDFLITAADGKNYPKKQ